MFMLMFGSVVQDQLSSTNPLYLYQKQTSRRVEEWNDVNKFTLNFDMKNTNICICHAPVRFLPNEKPERLNFMKSHTSDGVERTINNQCRVGREYGGMFDGHIVTYMKKLVDDFITEENI